MNEQSPIINPEEEASDEEFKAAMQAAAAAAHVDIDHIAGQTSTVSLDSLQGNEFAVEIEGHLMNGVFRVSGLTTFKLAADSSTPAQITLAKMVQRDVTMPFNTWIRETVTGNGDRPTRRIDVLAVDDNEETRRWTLNDAYITEIRYTDFDTSSSELVEEIVTIAYESLTETWTWSELH